MKVFSMMLVLAVMAPSPMVAQLEVDGIVVTQDPADSLYRAARREINRRNYEEALALFGQIRERYPESQHVAQSLYWEAFARHRMGNLREAVEMLGQLEVNHPNASSRTMQEARTLATRICGELAQRGDRECAERLRAETMELEGQLLRGESQRAQADVQRQQAELQRELIRLRGRTSQRAQGDDDLQVAALNALLNMDAERAVPILRRLLENRDTRPELRRRAVYLIAQHEDDATTDVLLEVVRNDPDPEVRRQAVFWLSQVDDEAAVDALISVLQNPADEELHLQALFALSQHDSRRAGQVLRDYAERDGAPVRVREQAIFWLGQHDDEENLDFLKTLYTDLDNDRLKERIFMAVSQADGDGQVDWLLDRALESNAPISLRKQAIFWAGQHDESVGRLIDLYDRVSDDEMKKQLIFVFGQHGETPAVDKLIDIARNDANREMRRQAIFWLGQSDDPRVVDLLLEIINP